MAPSKRRLASSQSTQSSQSSTTTRPPPKKRARHSNPPSTSHPTSPPTPPSAAPVASTSTSNPRREDWKLPPPLPEPKKRTIHPGSLRRLTSSRSASHSSSKGQDQVREKQTLSGNKIGGKSKDLKDGNKVEEIWVRNSSSKVKTGGSGGGIGFSAWLKKGVGAFVERG